MDNIFLVCDVIEMTKCYNIDFGVFSLNQEKAFDRVCLLYFGLLVLVLGLYPGLVYCTRLHNVW